MEVTAVTRIEIVSTWPYHLSLAVETDEMFNCLAVPEQMHIPDSFCLRRNLSLILLLLFTLWGKWNVLFKWKTCHSYKHSHNQRANMHFLTTQYPTKQLTGKHLNLECWILCSVYLYFLCHLSLCTVDIISRQLLKEIEISDIQWDGLSVCNEFHLYSFVCQLHFWHCQIVSIQSVQVFFVLFF